MVLTKRIMASGGENRTNGGLESCEYFLVLIHKEVDNGWFHHCPFPLKCGIHLKCVGFLETTLNHLPLKESDWKFIAKVLRGSEGVGALKAQKLKKC